MITYILGMILQRSPLLLVLMGGIVVAIVRWKLHPRISLLTLLGLVLCLLRLVTFTALFYALPWIRESMQWSLQATVNLYALVAVLDDLALAGIIILLVAVAFAKRTPLTVAYNRAGNLS